MSPLTHREKTAKGGCVMRATYAGLLAARNAAQLAANQTAGRRCGKRQPGCAVRIKGVSSRVDEIAQAYLSKLRAAAAAQKDDEGDGVPSDTSTCTGVDPRSQPAIGRSAKSAYANSDCALRPSNSPLASSASPLDNANLVKAAHALRSIIVETDDQDMILPTFVERHPRHNAVIRSNGGIKAVSRLLPHIYGWSLGGRAALTAPVGTEQIALEDMARNTRLLKLCEAFRESGGRIATMDKFGREQRRSVDDDDEGRGLTEAVAIDCEGTHLVPSILIQVCPVDLGGDGSRRNKRNGKVYLEQPRRRPSYGGGTQLSSHLKDLLADASIVKVFFDADGDVKSLGVPVNNALCLQREIALSRHGTTKQAHIPSLIDMANEYISKEDNDGSSASSSDGVRYLYQKNRTLQKWFGNRRRPGRRIHNKLLWYGAADAWATARMYEGFMAEQQTNMKAQRPEKKDENKEEARVQASKVADGGRKLSSAQIEAEMERRAAALMRKNANMAGIPKATASISKSDDASFFKRMMQWIP